MCEPGLSILATAGGLAPADAPPMASPLASAAAREPSTHLARLGTRRRLWELDGHAFWPVVGVCLPMPVLRQLASKLDLPRKKHDDYDLHCTAVTQCKQRCVLVETPSRAALQRAGRAGRRRPLRTHFAVSGAPALAAATLSARSFS